MIVTKYLCDICLTEIPKSQAERDGFFIANGNVEMEIKIRGIGQDPPTVHICNYCIIDTVAKQLDDRPRIARHE